MGINTNKIDSKVKPNSVRDNSHSPNDYDSDKAENRIEKYSSKDYSDFTTATTVLLSRFGFVSKHRLIIDALIGIAVGRTGWFKASQKAIAEQMRQYDAAEINEKSATQKVRRRIKSLLKAQEQLGVTIFEFKEGGINPETGEKYSQEFRAVLLEYVKDAVYRARTREYGSDYPNEVSLAAEEVALEVLSKAIPAEPADGIKPKRQNKDKIIFRTKQQSLGLVRRYITLLCEYYSYDGVMKQLAIDIPYLANEVDTIITNRFDTLPTIGSVLSRLGVNLVTSDADTLKSDAESPGQRKANQQPSSTKLVEPATQGAAAMVDAFISVGVQEFGCVILTYENGKATVGDDNVYNAATLRERLPDIVERCNERHLSVAIRPHPPQGIQLVQLDDPTAETLDAYKEHAFLALETSPSNYQLWLAFDSTEKDIRERLKQVAKCDWNASGSVRAAGSFNTKPGRQEPDGSYPMVRTVSSERGLLVIPDELERVGLLPPLPDKRAANGGSRTSQPKPTFIRAVGDKRESLPDIESFYDNAQLNSLGEPDISKADFAWAAMAAKCGYAESEIADFLSENSPKAKRKGQGWRYAKQTAAAAINAQ